MKVKFLLYNIIFFFIISSEYQAFSFSFINKKGSILFPGGQTKIIYEYYLDKNKKKVLHGNFKEFYTNGDISKELKYKNGFLNGKAVEYYPSQAIKWKGKYKNGKKNGKWIFFDKYNLKRMEGYFDHNGNIASITHFSSNKNKVKKEFFKDGKAIRVITWDITTGKEKSDNRFNKKE